MKKIKVLLISVLCILTLVSFSGCGNKKNPISADEFCDKLESKSFTVSDSTSEYASNNEVVESYAAISPDYGYQIEFLIIDSDSNAKAMFETNKSKFEKDKDNLSVTTNLSFSTYEKYTIQSNGKYKVVSRINNTLLYVNANLEYKDEIQSILEEIGY